MSRAERNERDQKDNVSMLIQRDHLSAAIAACMMMQKRLSARGEAERALEVGAAKWALINVLLDQPQEPPADE